MVELHLSVPLMDEGRSTRERMFAVGTGEAGVGDASAMHQKRSRGSGRSLIVGKLVLIIKLMPNWRHL